MLLDIYFWCIYVCVGVQLCSPTHALVNVYKPYDCPFIGSADNYTIAVICYKTHSAIALHMHKAVKWNIMHVQVQRTSLE